MLPAFLKMWSIVRTWSGLWWFCSFSPHVTPLQAGILTPERQRISLR